MDVIHSGIIVYRLQGGSLFLKWDNQTIQIKNSRDERAIMNSFKIKECGKINSCERLVVYRVKNQELSHHHQLLEYIINRNVHPLFIDSDDFIIAGVQTADEKQIESDQQIIRENNEALLLMNQDLTIDRDKWKGEAEKDREAISEPVEVVTWKAIKKLHPDKIIFIESGGMVSLFGSDAQDLAGFLGISLLRFTGGERLFNSTMIGLRNYKGDEMKTKKLVVK